MKTLAQWLAFIEQQHPSAIAMGLERVASVLERMGTRLDCPVITVAGTNGKGSTCAFLEAMLRAAGHKTALYTSPHLLRYNERVRISGAEATDAELCESFEAVEEARGATPLTYFEYGTLAALSLFKRKKADVAVLEVGLGGRLDAVNVIAPDCAVLTSVGIDHIEYLGGSRESIGAEKAGIFRAHRPAVIAEPDVPASVLAAPGEKFLLGKDFGYAAEGTQWSYWGPGGRRGGLAWPALRGAIQLRNASAALCALDALQERLPLAMQDVRRGLAEASLAGRFQVLPGRPQIILDVAHNPQAAKTLAQNLGDSGFAPETIAVCGMLRDKDIPGVFRELAPRITRWHFATLPPPRGALASELAEHLRSIDPRASASVHESAHEAFAAAQAAAAQNDKIVAFGSFLTVSDVMAWLKRRT
jgi:dihydrofolate synthase / folylpolyglutamate synthase